LAELAAGAREARFAEAFEEGRAARCLTDTRVEAGVDVTGRVGGAVDAHVRVGADALVAAIFELF